VTDYFYKVPWQNFEVWGKVPKSVIIARTTYAFLFGGVLTRIFVVIDMDGLFQVGKLQRSATTDRYTVTSRGVQ